MYLRVYCYRQTPYFNYIKMLFLTEYNDNHEKLPFIGQKKILILMGCEIHYGMASILRYHTQSFFMLY